MPTLYALKMVIYVQYEVLWCRVMCDKLTQKLCALIVRCYQ